MFKSLPLDKQQALEALEPLYKTRKQPTWYEKFAQLVQFVADNSELPKYIKKDNYQTSLYRFISIARDQYKAGTLDTEKKQMLEQIQGWQWEGSVHVKWLKIFTKLEKFIEENRRLPLYCTNKKSREYRLAEWIANIRKKRDVLDNKKKELLEQIPQWSWEKDPRILGWNQRYQQLLQFVANNRRMPIRDASDEEEYTLEKWVRRNRGNADKLSDERKILLEQIPGWKWIREGVPPSDPRNADIYEGVPPSDPRNVDIYESKEEESDSVSEESEDSGSEYESSNNSDDSDAEYIPASKKRKINNK
jgi:PAS domain-containing protein